MNVSRRPIASSSALYIVMLGVLSALPPLGIDMGLPAIPQMQVSLGVDAAEATRTLTIFLFGFSLGPILFGPLSDRYGRRPILLMGVALFSLAAVGCAAARSFNMLLALRLIQGVGAGAAAALPAAIVRDVFHGQAALTRQSYVTLVNAVAPLVAPLIGSAVLTFGGWPTVFHVLGGFGFVLLFVCYVGYAETAPLRTAAVPHVNTLRSAGAAYAQVLRNRQYLVGTALLGLTFGTMFAFIVASSLVFMGTMGVSSSTYSMLFAVAAAGTISGAAINVRLSRVWGSRRLMLIALSLSTLVSASLLLLSISGTTTVPGTVALLVLSNLCAGIVMPNATYLALRDVGHVAGSAAALQRSTQMMIGVASGATVGFVGGNPFVAMAGTMTLFATTALITFAAGNRVLHFEARRT